MRTLVVGDIHGGLRALKQVLLKAEITVDDKIIFLGDYVDGWPESAEVIEYLIKLSQSFNCIFIRGNHDKWCEDWLYFAAAPNIWINQGGKSTRDSYSNNPDLNLDNHRKFFHNMVNYYVDDKNRGFVHGGFKSSKGLGHESHHSDYYWDRDLLARCLTLHNFMIRGALPDFAQDDLRCFKHKEIYVGHTTTSNWQIRDNGILKRTNNPNYKCTVPINLFNVWNLDTGGGWDGKLTIMDIDTKEFWQSDLVKDLYPEIQGR